MTNDLSPRHPPEVVELGLRLTALSGGNCGRAEKLMLNEGHSVDRRTLTRWKTEQHPDRYEQILDEIRRELDDETKDMSKVLASQAQVVEQDMIRELATELHDIPARDKASAVRNLAQAASTHVQIDRLLSEKPTSITETRPPSEIIAELREFGVIEAEVVEEGE
jgi:hypothetical protein